MKNGVRRLRLERGFDQQELARLAGVSRQTLSSIEAGKTEPSTRIALSLARVLGCRVEALFWLEPEAAALDVKVALPATARPEASTRGRAGRKAQVSRAALAAVGDRWIAHLLPPHLPASLFMGADALMHAREVVKKRARVHPLRTLEALRRNVLVVGCDPAIGLLAARLGEDHPGERLVWIQATSTSALAALARGETHIAGTHLFDEVSGEFNVPFVRGLLPGRDLVVVNLARWREGLLVAKGNPRGIRDARDFGRKDVIIVNRELGAGARRLLDRLLREAGLRERSVRGYGREASGHVGVAQAVAMGAADAGIALESAALAMGLDFVPLAEERFDLVLPADFAQTPRGARILEVLGSRAFRRELASLGGYETTQSGQILAEVKAA